MLSELRNPLLVVRREPEVRRTRLNLSKPLWAKYLLFVHFINWWEVLITMLLWDLCQNQLNVFLLSEADSDSFVGEELLVSFEVLFIAVYL